jgi:hypothetical protein
MTETKKRTRAPKQLTMEQIVNGARLLHLSDKVDLFKDLKERIETEKKAMQEQIELINANVK